MQAQPHPFAQGSKIPRVQKMPGELWAALERPSGETHLLTAISILNLLETAASQGQELQL